MTTKKLQLASEIVTIGAIMLWERITRMRPASVPSIPPSFEAITPEWLTSALCSGHPGARVESLTLEGGSSGTTSRMLVKLDYNDRGKQAGLPERTFIKATTRFTSRIVAASCQAPHKETHFFNTIRNELDIEAPRAYFAGFELPSQRSMILLKATPDHVFTNPTIYINRSEAEDMVGLLAGLHTKYWNSPRLDSELNWAHKSYDYMVMLNDFGFEQRSQIGIDRSASVIPQKLLARRAELYPAIMRSSQMSNEGAQTLLHHDVHIGNWYKTPQGRMGLCDWQCLVRGNFASDLSYAISSALTVADRRAWEQDLLKLYLEKLRQAGIKDAPGFDATWLLYRQQIFHAFVFWVYTIGAGALQPDMQPDEFSMLNIERFANAMVDLDSLGSLD